MRRFSCAFLLVLIVFGCHSKKEETVTSCEKPSNDSGKKKFEMYSMSEMSLLMEQMYVDNQRLKERIKNGDTIGRFPSHFLKIHEAVMTDDKENDAFFKTQSTAFIKSQELIYQDPKNAKAHFNNGIDACIKCHQVKCGGPIPRIKKLYIK